MNAMLAKLKKRFSGEKYLSANYAPYPGALIDRLKQLNKNKFYELRISVDQNAFDKLNYIYADEQANVETALHNHQMTHRNTIVVKPKFDTFGVPHSMKDLNFWTELDGTPYHSSDGTVVKFWTSFTPVAIATSQEVADWSKWKGGIKDLPPRLASNLQ
ncbi:uncharacterized protein C8R40DRAFT_1067615 [Lentinula edodes]|uniref:uncharacterized protein n=1 Tax=Lentinula edodes TaxID=5353 RepID=UPI001E8EB55C|nr:uncharacterized protein C8R40DRAFT_1067615 [Lentinula edodes]KAH7878055.1 hypothetical protein C8R40DRAFT_1067615 [Lentinula edodes]